MIKTGQTASGNLPGSPTPGSADAAPSTPPGRETSTNVLPFSSEPTTPDRIEAAQDPSIATGTRRQRLQWAGARLAFYAYILFSMVTLVGGFLTAPLMTWLFYDDWRFWRHARRGWRLFPHGWHIAWLMLRRENLFMLSVPLTSPPQAKPDTHRVEIAPDWQHGHSCGDCQRCCHILSLRCPVLDTDTGFCSGYQSFYWRYFNCGRYPSETAEIEYYGCDKWRMKSVPVETVVSTPD